MDNGARRTIEAQFFTQGGQVDEATFWREVERLAGAGALAQVTAETAEDAPRWKLTPKGQEAARLIRQQEVAG